MSVVWAVPDHLLDNESGPLAFQTHSASTGEVSQWRDDMLSQPGVVVEFNAPPSPPPGLCAATAAIAASLFDQDTRVWLSASADCKAVRTYLRRHTQSLQVAEPMLADFAVIACLGERAPLGSFFCGTHAFRDRSTTLIVQVDGIERDGPWRLTGPAFRGETRLGVKGLGEKFLCEWALNARLHPRGVDVLLACGARCCYLSRTTRIGISSARTK